MRYVFICLWIATFCTVPALAQHAHEGDIIVGVTGPTVDTLGIEADLDEPIVLNPVSGLLNGWTAADPGFDHLEADEPDEGFFMLASGASIRLEVVAIDAGLAVVESGGGAFADAVGESILLGGDELHTHPTWYAQSAVLGGGWTGTLAATFKLTDTGSTGYNDSEIFTMNFTNVPEPASVLWLFSAGVAGLIRRRVGRG